MKNPVRRAFQKFCGEPRVQRVSGAIRNQPAQHRLANESEVAEQVQSLMPDKLVRKAEGGIVQDPFFGENDRVLQRAAADQTASLQLFHFVIEAERSGWRDKLRVVVSRKLNVEVLPADQWMREIDVVLHTEARRWVDAQSLIAIFENKLFGDPNVSARPVLTHDAHLGNGFGVGHGASIKDRN